MYLARPSLASRGTGSNKAVALDLPLASYVGTYMYLAIDLPLASYM